MNHYEQGLIEDDNLCWCDEECVCCDEANDDYYDENQWDEEE